MMKWDEVIDSRETVLSFQYFQLSSSPFSFQHSSTSFSLQFPWERRPRPRFLCSLTQRLYTSSLRYVSRCKRTPTLSTANNDDDLFFFLSDVSYSLSNSFFLSLPPFSPPFCSSTLLGYLGWILCTYECVKQWNLSIMANCVVGGRVNDQTIEGSSVRFLLCVDRTIEKFFWDFTSLLRYFLTVWSNIKVRSLI